MSADWISPVRLSLGRKFPAHCRPPHFVYRTDTVRNNGKYGQIPFHNQQRFRLGKVCGSMMTREQWNRFLIGIVALGCLIGGVVVVSTVSGDTIWGASLIRTGLLL